MSILKDEVLARDINVALDIVREGGLKPRDAAIVAMGRNNTFIIEMSEHQKHIVEIVSALPSRRTKAAMRNVAAKSTFLRRRAMSDARSADKRHQGILKHDS